ncbi:MAG TPA: DHA2 family efflux MFS transporter permease subunit [Polyangiaceae bacterium]|nr:DHA2 family efflux MFS transporter permease subunit [Polyangiaceae bacterium]
MSSAKAPANALSMLPWLVAVAFFMEALDTTILNTALPAMATALHVVPLSMKAVLTSYTLSLAVFIPLSGWVADRFGTRVVFSSAIGLFTLGSLLCGLSSNIHVLVACRILQGCGGAMMVPVGRLTMVHAFPKTELVRAMSFVAIPALVGPMLGPLAGGLIVDLLHWRVIFFVNLPIGLLGLFLVYRHLPDYRAQHMSRLDWVGLTLFGSGVALLSYVLEVFGEHTLSGWECSFLLAVSVLLLLAYVKHASSAPHPLLRLDLFQIRTLRSALTGSFATRLGVGGMPFLLPLLYQVGLGYSPVQSGLLILPQSIAAISFKLTMPLILKRLGYRNVLLTNTLLLGALIGLFSTIGANTPVWVIGLQALAFGFLSSLQFTSMNTLVYADVSEADASMASTIASTLQQMSVSFGIAAASLTTALFIPNRFHSEPKQMIQGIHHTFLVLGGLTIVSAAVFRSLRPGDGDNVSRHGVAPAVSSAVTATEKVT